MWMNLRLRRRRFGWLFVPLGCAIVAGVSWTLLTPAQGSVSAAVATVDPLQVWTPPVAVGPAEMANQVVDSQVGMTSLPWRFVGLSADGRSIELVYVAGDGKCTTPFGIDVQETPNSVDVWALGSTVKTQTPCPQTALYGHAVITLNDALGARRLLHAPVDSAWLGRGQFLNR